MNLILSLFNILVLYLIIIDLIFTKKGYYEVFQRVMFLL